MSPLPAPASTYWLTRFLFLRFLGLIYLIAFLVAAQQFLPLLGSHGIFPVSTYLAEAKQFYGSGFSLYWHLPTLFWVNDSDFFIQAIIRVGVVLSFLVLLGLSNGFAMFLLWGLYLSLIHVGQIFYGYGWEMMVVEAGFLAIFLVPFLSFRPFPPSSPPAPIVLGLLRWMLFRVMFGAALIKLRGDPCWRDLTCLDYHFETQPVPNPLSWYFHHLPHWALAGGVLFNHFAEVVAPWMTLGPRRLRQVGGLVIAAFQATLILSGNLSWLNYLTLALCIPCFDDRALSLLLPAGWKPKVETLAASAKLSVTSQGVSYALAVLVGLLSIQPTLNLVSNYQVMNESYDPFFLVNTYGAFGSVTRERNEIVLEGTSDASIGPGTEWKAYEFKCKPGNVHRRPCVVSPFHYRLDWQMWFAAMGDYRESPWLLILIEKMLRGEKPILGLLAENPFPEKPPQYIRATLYRYRFTDWNDSSGAWWRRERVGVYLPPLKLNGNILDPLPAEEDRIE